MQCLFVCLCNCSFLSSALLFPFSLDPFSTLHIILYIWGGWFHVFVPFIPFILQLLQPVRQLKKNQRMFFTMPSFLIIIVVLWVFQIGMSNVINCRNVNSSVLFDIIIFARKYSLVESWNHDIEHCCTRPTTNRAQSSELYL